MVLIKLSILVAAFASLLYFTAKVRYTAENVVNISPSRPLTGKLSQTPKNTIQTIEKLFEGQLLGPECQVLHNGALYSSSISGHLIKAVDGKIVKSLEIYKHNPECRELQCSHPLGMRYWKDEKFVFADGRLGIIVVDFENESFKQVYSASTVIGDWSNMFADDIEFIDNETIIFSDMTPKYGFKDYQVGFFEMAKDGRLIKLNLNTGAYELFVDNLLTPNGLIAHPDKQSLIVSSTAALQLLRVYYAGPKKGSVEVFADGLPGIPDNLRATSSGKTFWISLYVAGTPLPQRLGQYPKIRKWLSYYSQLLVPLTLSLAPNHQVFIEMDFDGDVVSSIHETEGRLKGTTNVIDDGKYLYFGSVHRNYIGRALKPEA
ncbi:unnamed protein product [Bursaphelenchus xylophilus]|uniref:(pine wood nematode) hypothetical protein n=1 Tax=Bursaphelenchus xylophilus TaxID=6326 RepID=A0A1I7RUA9_BURXY|nr:unnamed protein product [Bursaphelenchus xylophilus]CAG9113995.1 unnamed protein product [Bursaphelenchus xylophilus]